jgi:two-component sensor histidine kinase/DNA-binding NarL/FixJ family response regulator
MKESLAKPQLAPPGPRGHVGIEAPGNLEGQDFGAPPTAPLPVKLLLVDDTPDNLHSLCAVLEKPGFQFVTAGSGTEALEHLLREDFAVIVLDVRMPDMDGFETARLIRERERSENTPIIFLTGHVGGEASMFKGYELGAVDYLVKPFVPAILKAKVAVFAELFRAQMKLQAEIAVRQQAEEQIRALNAGLEARVAERTQELRTANDQLQREIAERQKAEAAIRASLQEKEVLLKEIHHRVKNNLQVISSILQLQGRKIDDPRYRRVFGECQDRVRTMALVHEKLYRSPSLSAIDLAEEVRDLVRMLASSHAHPNVRLDVQAETALSDIHTAVPIGLLVNELVSNALKHAFPDGRGGSVNVTLRRLEPERLLLSVRDDGRGLPKDFDWDSANSLGLTTIQALARQIRAKVEVRQQGGAEFSFTFPTPQTASTDPTG